MINEIQQDAEESMQKTIESFTSALSKIRTGRAHPSLLEHLRVDYYGSPTPLNQAANVSVEDARTLSITTWEANMVKPIEKAILDSGLGLNPMTAGMVIRVPMPPLTEERRRDFVKAARQEAEGARIAIRNIRRNANNDLKELEKEKEISEDDERRGQDLIQKSTNKFVAIVDEKLKKKEADLMEV
ncbi:MAG: ribosome recycling factor [bacterium]